MTRDDLGKQVGRFFTTPASAGPLAMLRIGLAGVLLYQAFLLSGSVPEFYGKPGVVQRYVMDAFVPDVAPRVGRLTERLGLLELNETQGLQAVFGLYLAAVAALLCGWRTRVAAVVAWFLHLALMSSNRIGPRGVDELAHIGLFYCIWFPVGHAWSVDRL